MFSFFKNTSEESCVLVFDIGSASVGGAVVLLRDGEVPCIVYTTRTDMVFQEELDFDRFQLAMKQALEETANKITAQGIPNAKEHYTISTPEKAYCILSSPWYALQTTTSKHTDEQEFTIDETFITQQAEMAVSAFKDKQEVKEHLGTGNARLIEKNILDTRLNGYSVDNPHGKSARTFEMTLTCTIAPNDTLSTISGVLRSAFLNDIEVSFHAFSSAAFQVTRCLPDVPEGFLFVDVSGEVTDIALIQRGVLEKVVSFPVGKKTMIRAVANKMKTTPPEALSLLRLLHQGRMSDSQQSRMKKTIDEVKSEWEKSFQKAITNISETAVPQHMYVTADVDVLSLIAEMVSAEELARYTMTDNAFTVHEVNPSFFSGMCQFGDGVSRDVFLIIGTVFADSLGTV